LGRLALRAFRFRNSASVITIARGIARCMRYPGIRTQSNESCLCDDYTPSRCSPTHTKQVHLPTTNELRSSLPLIIEIYVAFPLLFQQQIKSTWQLGNRFN